jgi:predicted ATP-grasp superfamily ATP-dependent carboligase
LLSDRPDVLILDGHALATLAFTRSLGRAGIRVTVGAESRKAAAGRSKFCAELLVYPSPMHPQEFRRWLFETVSRRPFSLLIGTTDQTIPLLDDWRVALGRFVPTPLADHGSLRRANDKAETLKLAESLGLTIPPTHFIESVDQLDEVAARSAPPWVIKPRCSIACWHGRRFRVNVDYAFDLESLRTKYAALHQQSPWPMLQGYVPGVGVGCFFLLHNGEILARFQHRRLREIEPTGSGSSLRMSVAADPVLTEASERLLRALGLDGLVMVEFRIAPDGPAYLMEINARPWGSMHLALAAGVDFPLLWYRAVTGAPVEKTSSYREGVSCRYLAGDLRHLEGVLSGPPPHWSMDFPKWLPTVLAFLKFYGRELYYDDFAEGDWRPGVVGVRKFFGELVRRFRPRLRRAAWAGAKN